MPFIDMTVFFVGGCVGGAIVWHFKAQLQTFWRSSQSAAATLEADASALLAKAQAMKSAVTTVAKS